MLYAGRDRPVSLPRALRSKGARVETFELLDDPVGQDLSRIDVQLQILVRVSSGEFDAVFMATPCSSFCVALDSVRRRVC